MQEAAQAAQASQEIANVAYAYAGAALGAGRRELPHLLVVALALGQRGLEDRRVAGHPDEEAVLDQVGEVAGLDALAGEVVDLLPLLHGAEREQRHDLRLPAREERRSVRPRADLHLGRDVADLLLRAPVGTTLVDRDLLAHEVLVDGKPIKLRPTEYRLLYHLVSNAGWVMPHETLLSKVWGYEYRDETQYLRLYITYLRQKIEKDPEGDFYVRQGPGSVCLPPASAEQYVRTRFRPLQGVVE